MKEFVNFRNNATLHAVKKVPKTHAEHCKVETALMNNRTGTQGEFKICIHYHKSLRLGDNRIRNTSNSSQYTSSWCCAVLIRYNRYLLYVWYVLLLRISLVPLFNSRHCFWYSLGLILVSTLQCILDLWLCGADRWCQ